MSDQELTSDFDNYASAEELQAIEDRGRPYLGQNPPNEDQAAAVRAHNEARASRGAAPLEWDGGLAYEAYQWATECANENKMKHRGNGKVENVYSSWSSQGPSTDNVSVKATKAWLDEEKNYRNAPSDDAGYQAWVNNWDTWKDSGHYAMCMSKETRRVGIWHAVSSQGWVYCVAAYDPPGNFSQTKEHP